MLRARAVLYPSVDTACRTTKPPLPPNTTTPPLLPPVPSISQPPSSSIRQERKQDAQSLVMPSSPSLAIRDATTTHSTRHRSEALQSACTTRIFEANLPVLRIRSLVPPFSASLPPSSSSSNSFGTSGCGGGFSFYLLWLFYSFTLR